MYGIGKADNALRVLRYASQFVTLLAAHTAFVTAAPVSFMPPHSFRPSFRSITPRSYPKHVLQGMASLSHSRCHYTNGMHIPFRKPTATILTGFHSATLRPTFISVAFSPPAANSFARLAYHCLRYGAALSQTLAHALTFPQSLEVHVTFRPFTVCPSFPTVTLLSTPASGARSHFHSFLIPVALTARYAAMLQPLLLPGAANASFCRRRFYLFADAQD